MHIKSLLMQCRNKWDTPAESWMLKLKLNLKVTEACPCRRISTAFCQCWRSTEPVVGQPRLQNPGSRTEQKNVIHGTIHAKHTTEMLAAD
jgi:hypothetical protein